MAGKVFASVLKSIEALQRLDIGEILVSRGDQASFCSAFHSSFNIFEQQNKASLLNKADRKIKGTAMAQIILYFF